MLSQIFGLRAIRRMKVLKIDGITSTFGLQHTVNKTTHIIGDSSYCIDWIFTSQPDLLMESGVHSSLHPNCYHQITYAK